MNINWVKCTDRQPENGQWLAAVVDKRPMALSQNYFRLADYDNGWKVPEGMTVTHWTEFSEKE